MAKIVFVAGMNTRRATPEMFRNSYYRGLVEALSQAGISEHGPITLPKPDEVSLVYWTDLIRDELDPPAKGILRDLEDTWLSFCRKRLLSLDSSANYDITAKQQTLITRALRPVLIQAAAYMGNVAARVLPFPRAGSGLRDQVIARFQSMITDETQIVIGHSLGSVIAYEGLRERRGRHDVKLFLTVGSPIGTPNLIYKRLGTEPPHAFPDVGRWCNVACAQDVFFVPVERIRELFKGQVEDFSVRHGAPWSPNRTHRLRSYFRHPVIGTILADAWSARSQPSP